MKKLQKKLILPIVTLLGLASCGGNPEVEFEVAEQRAQKIIEVQNSENF